MFDSNAKTPHNRTLGWTEKVLIMTPQHSFKYLFLVLIILGNNVLQAQVHIRERVEISVGNALHDMEIEEGAYVASRSGLLRIGILYVHKTWSPTPSGAYVVMTTRDTTYQTEVLPHLPCAYEDTQLADSCTLLLVYRQFHSNSPCGPGYDWVDMGQVATGDTIRFAYYAEYANTTMIVSGSTIYLRTPNPPNCPHFTPPEVCDIAVGYADTTVRFTVPASRDVYPAYQGYNDTTSKRNYVDLELRAGYGNAPIPNYWVKVYKPVLADSGGHSHDGNRPMGRYNYPVGSTNLSDTLVERTDSTGKLKFRYVASQFGGVEKIRARLVSDTTKWDTLSLKTRVPGLDSLGPGSHYELVGTPNNHSGTNDPCRTVAPVSRHYKNHYGTSRILQAVRAIADRYDSLHPGIKLRVNDMSLIYGGLFDANHNAPNPRLWATPHKEHRIGINADIGITGINAQNQCVNLDTTKVKKIMQDKTGKEPLREYDPDHFHVYIKED